MVFSYSFLLGLVWVLARLAACFALSVFFFFHLVFIVIGLVAGGGWIGLGGHLK